LHLIKEQDHGVAKHFTEQPTVQMSGILDPHAEVLISSREQFGVSLVGPGRVHNTW